MDDGPLQWRVDASTSRAVRALWTFGTGTFLATVTIIVSWRLYDLLRELAGWSVAVGALLALAAAAGVALVGGFDRLGRRLPVAVPTGAGADRARDAVVGTVAMIAVVVALMAVGRVVSQGELLAVGAGPFTLLAALLLPFALFALLAASFLRSVGTLDVEDGVLYLHDPDETVPLEHVEGVRVRPLGETGSTLVKLEYATPGGQYVPGPRWLVLPTAVARELRAVAED